ncbi:hypothetical protein SEA_MAGRITTE_194 [Microbacterium phage Magritte]|nr:hypothetical protein SEA_MAGRITTE_194 [Microbacterium phage Magritte]
MTELDRAAVIRELEAIKKRASVSIDSKGPVSAAVALARSEMANTLKIDIESGTYDREGSTSRDYFLETLRARWFALTPRQRRKLYDLDSLLQISVRHLADPQKTKSLSDPAEDPEPETQTLSTPKTRTSPWFWPVVALSALLVVVLGGTALSLLIPTF